MRDQYYSTQFDADATVFWFLRDADNSWELVLTIAWSVQKCSFDRKGNFHTILSAAAGSRPRAGGVIGSKSEFPYAPEPGEVMRIGYAASGGVTFRSGVGMPPPPPGGHQPAYDPRGRNAVSDGPGPRDIPPAGGGSQSMPDPSGSSSSSS
jgi:hypothetical protein